MTYRQAVADAHLDLLERDPRALILGEGVTDPIGIFGTTKTAHERFPGRIIETPLSETMLTGACVGLALEGWHPLYVHARFDFALFTFEHLINVAAKVRYLQKGREVPMALRVLVGRGWGQGPTHGQNFMAALANVPGLRVFVPAYGSHYGPLLREAMTWGGPSVIVEYRRLHDREIEPVREAEDLLYEVQVAAIGDTIIDAQEAAIALRGMGIGCHVVAVEQPGFENGQLWEVPTVICENAHGRFGIGAGLAGQPAIRGQGVRLLTPPFHPLPASEALEPSWYVSTRQIVEAACEMLGTRPEPAALAGIGADQGRDGRREAF